MGHAISGLIARREALAAFASESGLHAPATLAQGFAFLPLGADHVDTLCERLPTGATGAADPEGFGLLTARFLDVLRGLTQLGLFAYVETDYFGGEGDQGALVIENGRVAQDPARDSVGPINDALRRIGVARGADDPDAFDTVGLGAYRNNDDWIEAGAAARSGATAAFTPSRSRPE